GLQGADRKAVPVNADVIDHVALGKGGIIDTALSAPVSPDGEIDEQIERAIERPHGVALAFVLEAEVFRVIHEEVDAFLAPLQGIDMKVQPGCRHMDARSLLCVQDMVIGRGVDSPVDAAGLVTEMFHDVDLAALWPSYLIDIGAEQPNRRPGTSGAGEF